MPWQNILIVKKKLFLQILLIKLLQQNCAQIKKIAPCRKDNIITFGINGSGTVSEGATSCSPAENANFTWNFTSNESMIHFSTALYPNAPNDVTLVSLNETELVISFPYTVSSITLTVTVTFQH